MVRSGARFCSGACRVAAHRADLGLPSELVSTPNWVRYSSKKVPLRIDGRAASPTDPRTWSTYADAVSSTVGAGVGYVLDGSGLACIDLDHCLDEKGRPLSWVVPILEKCPRTYVEISPSRTGLHLWGFGLLDSGRRITVDGGTVEAYSSQRYLTITGERFTRGRFASSHRRLADLTPLFDSLGI